MVPQVFYAWQSLGYIMYGHATIAPHSAGWLPLRGPACDRTPRWHPLGDRAGRLQSCRLTALVSLFGLVSVGDDTVDDCCLVQHAEVTNVGSEGSNRVIKSIGRDAYGFRNPGSPALTRPVSDHLASPWTLRCPLISLSPHPAIVLASSTELSYRRCLLGCSRE